MKCRLQWTVLMIAMIVVIDGGDDGKALRAAPLVGWWQSGKNTGSWRQIRAMGEVEQKPPNRKLPPNPRITRSGAPEAIGVCVGTFLGLLLFEYTVKRWTQHKL